MSGSTVRATVMFGSGVAVVPLLYLLTGTGSRGLWIAATGLLEALPFLMLAVFVASGWTYAKGEMVFGKGWSEVLMTSLSLLGLCGSLLVSFLTFSVLRDSFFSRLKFGDWNVHFGADTRLTFLLLVVTLALISSVSLFGSVGSGARKIAASSGALLLGTSLIFAILPVN